MRSPRVRWVATYGVVILILISGAVAVVRRPLWFADQRTTLHLWRSGYRGKFVEVQGNRIHYLESVPATAGPAPTLVMIHGLGARAQDWSPMLPALAQAGFHVYALDLPGYGLSSHPDVSYTIGYEEAAVVSFMQALHLAHADVAGWSMGGWVALKLTADHPELVDRLALYDSAGVYFPVAYDVNLFTPTNRDGVSRLWAMLTPKPLRLPDFVVRDLVRRIQGNAWVTRRSMAAMTTGRDLMEFRLGEIQRPTLIMWGTEDRLIPISAGERIVRGIHGSTFVPVQGCGHLAPAKCSGQVLPATLAFFQQKPVPGSVQVVVSP